LNSGVNKINLPIGGDYDYPLHQNIKYTNIFRGAVMSYESKIEDGIIIFKFNNPKVNAIDMNVIKGLDEAVDKLNSDEELKGIVLTGEGRFFSGGFCLKTFTSFTSSKDVIDWFKFEENTLLKLYT
jgi:enoyl-CoA hydratase/carnithine racemase